MKGNLTQKLMVRLLSKITLIVAALALISTQAQAQTANGLPTLYRNGEPINPGAPIKSQPEQEMEADASSAAEMAEPLPEPESETQEPIVVPPPVEHEAADEALPAAEPQGLIATPNTGGGIMNAIISLALVVLPIAAIAGGFMYMRQRRKAAVIDDALPPPALSVADSPSKIREVIAEMHGPGGQSQSA